MSAKTRLTKTGQPAWDESDATEGFRSVTPNTSADPPGFSSDDRAEESTDG